MALVAAFDSGLARAGARGAPRIAYVEVLRSMAAAEAMWRDLQSGGAWATPFQRFAFLAAWQEHIGQADGFQPLIVVARDAAQRPLLLLPLAERREFGLRCARFMGGKHATFNAPVACRTFAASMTPADLEALLDGLRAPPIRIDLLVFEQQPLHWHGLPNPLRRLPAQPSINGCPRLSMQPDAAPTDLIRNSLRRFLRNKKERKLQNLAGYRHFEADSDADIDRILDVFFAVKPQRMAAQGLPDIFADAAVQRFVRQACHARLADGRRAVTLHALECDDEVLAIYAGMADGQRFSTMFGTYTESPNARYSPGKVLTRVLIDHYAERNYSGFDLGIGDSAYKYTFCKENEALFDSYVGLSYRGTAVATAMAHLAGAKRRIKQNPTLLTWAARARGLWRGGAPAAAEE